MPKLTVLRRRIEASVAIIAGHPCAKLSSGVDDSYATFSYERPCSVSVPSHDSLAYATGLCFSALVQHSACCHGQILRLADCHAAIVGAYDSSRWSWPTLFIQAGHGV
eukprot:4419237-Pleurochrysis_carterae.AAC.1